jgi:hypothetical protein
VGQAGLGVLQEVGCGGWGREGGFVVWRFLQDLGRFGRGLVFGLIRFLGFGEEDAEPAITNQAALGGGADAEGDMIVGADPHGVAGGEVAGFGAGFDEGGEGLEVLAVVVE